MTTDVWVLYDTVVSLGAGSRGTGPAWAVSYFGTADGEYTFPTILSPGLSATL